MKSKIKSVLTALILSYLSLSPIASADEEVAPSKADIIGKGLELARLIQASASTPIKKLRDHQAIQAMLTEQGCQEYEYAAYVMSYQGDNFLYLIATKEGTLVHGKHFKTPFKGRNIDPSAFEIKVSNCSDAGSVKRLIQPVVVKYYNSQLDEFDVMQSALYDLRMEVKYPDLNQTVFVDASREKVIGSAAELDTLTIKPPSE